MAGSPDRSGDQNYGHMNHSIENIKVPQIGSFDTLLKRAS